MLNKRLEKLDECLYIIGMTIKQRGWDYYEQRTGLRTILEEVMETGIVIGGVIEGG